jgi:gamma-tubulin complex component 2
MENLARLTKEAGNKKGGALLNVIHRLMISSSDKSIRDLFEFLLEKASQPYLHMLKKWVFHGMLEDPFGEFIIKENRNCRKENIERDFNDQYWQDRFTYREEMLPVFLVKYKEKILHSGKYLNVIRECGFTDEIRYPWPEHEQLLSGGGLKATVLSGGGLPGDDEEMKDVEQQINAGGPQIQ